MELKTKLDFETLIKCLYHASQHTSLDITTNEDIEVSLLEECLAHFALQEEKVRKLSEALATSRQYLVDCKDKQKAPDSYMIKDDEC